ncbi:MAG TPA: class I SAM-dependent methyltransferase [Thermoanaerobaculia bacterium]|nr:class I SAM-dependent methyltransferase [Thermoanaerobaculia bacterium]
MGIQVRKAGWVLRHEGVRALAARALRRAASAVFEHGSVTFFARDLSEGEPASTAVPGVKAHVASQDDLEKLLHGSDPLQPAPVLRERFRQGDLCFAATDRSGRAVHTRWVSLARAPVAELDLDFVPGPDAAYFYNGYTHPGARRLGIDGLVRCHIFATLRGGGAKRAYSYVRGDNPGGLAAARKWQRPIGTVRYLRIGWARPLVFGVRGSPLAPLLRRPSPAAAEERARRELAWRGWFEGWLREPIAKRSIGCHEVSEGSMRATADHVASALGLDPDRDVVLDLGCSSALVTRWVATRSRRLVGADFIPGLLASGRSDLERRRAEGAPCGTAEFLASDGRSLPFPAGAFTKAYCSGVIHTLPSHTDGVRMIHELVRVCRPGGVVLIAAVPDRGKLWRAIRAAWRRAGPAGRARLAVALALPAPVKRGAKTLLRRFASGWGRENLVYLEYDLRALARELERRGLRCRVLDFPERYWSEDFRETRSNLLIHLPGNP